MKNDPIRLRANGVAVALVLTGWANGWRAEVVAADGGDHHANHDIARGEKAGLPPHASSPRRKRSRVCRCHMRDDDVYQLT